MGSKHLPATELYKSHGQERPPQPLLEQYIAKSHTEAVRAAGQLVIADMHIDMACYKPASAEAHIQQARGALETALAVSAAGNTATVSHGSAQCAVNALLRLAELDNWQRSAKRLPLKLSYIDMLSATYHAEQFVHDGHTDAEASLIQFMVVLLGARAEARGSVSGWIGRLALQREDRGPSANWDCAITDGTPLGYQLPRVTLEIKKTYAGGAVNPGSTAVRLRAKVFQFNNPTRVIASCLNELDGALSTVVCEEPLLDSAQLDDITVRIRQRVDHPPQK